MITTPATSVTLGEALKPCPFCGADLQKFGPVQHNHPRNGCWISSVKIERHEYDAWNQRVTTNERKD